MNEGKIERLQHALSLAKASSNSLGQRHTCLLIPRRSWRWDSGLQVPSSHLLQDLGQQLNTVSLLSYANKVLNRLMHQLQCLEEQNLLDHYHSHHLR